MSERERVEALASAEREVIAAIEAQFDIHAMDAEDWAELWVTISRALAKLASLSSIPAQQEEVTPEMVEVGIRAWMYCESTRTADILRATYLAMRSAALRSDEPVAKDGDTR